MAREKDVGEGNTQYENVIDTIHVSHRDEPITDFSHNDMHIFYRSMVNGKIANQWVDPIVRVCDRRPAGV
jgi:hypothetical protein